MSLRIICVGVFFLTAAAMADAPAGRPATLPATQPASRLIELHFKNTAPQQAFTQLAKEAGVTLSIDHGDAAAFWARHTEPITCEIPALNYWEALHELCVAAKITARASTEQEIVLEEATVLDGCTFAVVHGLVQFELHSLLSVRHVEMARTPKVTSRCRFDFSGRAPVALHALRSQAIQISAFTDQDGKTIPVQMNQPMSAWSDDGLTDLYIIFNRGPKVRKIGRIAGVMTAVLRGEAQTLEVPCNAGRVKRTMSGLDFDIMPRYVNDVCDVEIKVSTTGDKTTWNIQRDNLMASWPQLYDAMGRMYQSVDAKGRGGSEFELVVHYRWPADGPALGQPQKLIWKFSSAGRALPVPFEFKDVPLDAQ